MKKSDASLDMSDLSWSKSFEKRQPPWDRAILPTRTNAPKSPEHLQGFWRLWPPTTPFQIVKMSQEISKAIGTIILQFTIVYSSFVYPYPTAIESYWIQHPKPRKVLRSTCYNNLPCNYHATPFISFVSWEWFPIHQHPTLIKHYDLETTNLQQLHHEPHPVVSHKRRCKEITSKHWSLLLERPDFLLSLKAGPLKLWKTHQINLLYLVVSWRMYIRTCVPSILG